MYESTKYAIVAFIVGALISYYAYRYEHQRLIDDGCLVLGKEGEETPIAQGVKIVGTVWICDEDRKRKTNDGN